jgi:hypothetical protein
LIDGAPTPELPAGALVLELALALHAAMSNAVLTPAATTPAFLMDDTKTSSLYVRGC